MFEALESRQLFSVALMTATPAAAPVMEPALVVVDADATATKPKPKAPSKPDTLNTYLTYTMEGSFVSLSNPHT